MNAKGYLIQQITTPNKSLIKHTVTKDKNGKPLVIAESIIPGIDLTKCWWPESLELQIKELLDKKDKTEFEEELVECSLEFFETHSANPEDFVDFDTYMRFCNTFCEDFF